MLSRKGDLVDEHFKSIEEMAADLVDQMNV
jgi:hypothetical protein